MPAYFSIPIHPDHTEEISVFPSGEHDLPVHLSPLRPRFSAMGLYQDPQADCSSRTGAGVTGSFLHRRHPSHGRVEGETERPGVRPSLPTAMPGFLHQHGEDNTGTNPIPGLPGFHDRFDQLGAQAPTGETQKNQSGSSEIGGAELISARSLARLLGKMTATSNVIPPAPLFYRHLQMDLAKALRADAQNYETELRRLSSASKEELIWWDTHLVRWNGKSVMTRDPELTIDSDASKLGWGATSQGVSTGGPWSTQESARHINCLELMAAALALKTFAKNPRRGCRYT